MPLRNNLECYVREFYLGVDRWHFYLFDICHPLSNRAVGIGPSGLLFSLWVVFVDPFGNFELSYVQGGPFSRDCRVSAKQ